MEIFYCQIYKQPIRSKGCFHWLEYWRILSAIEEPIDGLSATTGATLCDTDILLKGFIEVAYWIIWRQHMPSPTRDMYWKVLELYLNSIDLMDCWDIGFGCRNSRWWTLCVQRAICLLPLDHVLLLWKSRGENSGCAAGDKLQIYIHITRPSYLRQVQGGRDSSTSRRTYRRHASEHQPLGRDQIYKYYLTGCAKKLNDMLEKVKVT